MKAKVKDIGEIVDVKFVVHPNPNVDDTYWWCEDKQKSYHKNELDFIKYDIDWEQRRYELAKEAMNGLLCAIVDGVNPKPIVEDTVNLSLTLADELIRKLKE
jgi:hypothetical protein